MNLHGQKAEPSQRLVLLTQPVFLGLVAVLALNDAVLKHRFPGFVTGKLSDVAGVAIVVIVLGALSGLPRWSSAATAIAFTALKLSPVVAALAAPLLGGITRNDPTDLLALLVLVPTARWMQHHLGADRFSVRSWALLPLALVGTVSTTTATSCIELPKVRMVIEGNGRLEAIGTTTIFATSDDGGATWESVSEPVASSAAPTTERCTTSGDCVRVVDHARIEEQRGNEAWHTSFAYSKEQVERMRLRDTSNCDSTTLEEGLFGSVALAERGQWVVAMGRTGVLRRDGDGPWQRVAVPTGGTSNSQARPLSTAGPSWLAKLRLAPVALVLLAPAMLLFRTLGGRKRHWWIGTIVALAAAALLVGVDLFVLFTDFDYVPVGLFNVAVALFALAVAVALACRPAGSSAAPQGLVPHPLPPPPFPTP
jgi:hypothetical protein